MDIMGATYQVFTDGERRQLEAFLDTYRSALPTCLEGLTEEEARRRLVPSKTTLLGLVKHAAYTQRVWFHEAVSGTPRAELGMPPTVDDSFDLAPEDTVAGVLADWHAALDEVRPIQAEVGLDDIVTGHRVGPITVRWIFLHLIRELAQHCGHAEILREQVLAARADVS